MSQILSIKKRALIATAAAAKMCAASFQANAGIIYSGPINEVVDNTEFEIDIDGVGENDFVFSHTMGFSSTEQLFLGNASVEFTSATGDFHTTDGGFDLANYGQLIDSDFSPIGDVYLKLAGAGTVNGLLFLDDAFSNGGSGFLGFNFLTGNHGWLSFSIAEYGLGTTSSFVITVNDWAYEDTGKAIRVGDTGSVSVPEPSTWALFALGAYGISRRRKRNAA